MPLETLLGLQTGPGGERGPHPPVLVPPLCWPSLKPDSAEPMLWPLGPGLQALDHFCPPGWLSSLGSHLFVLVPLS